MTTGLKDGIKSYSLTAVRGGVHVACGIAPLPLASDQVGAKLVYVCRFTYKFS